MITINLLPIELFKQQQKGKKFLVGFSTLMLVLIIGLAALKLIVFDSHISELTSKASGLETEKNTLTKQESTAIQTTKAVFEQWEKLESIMELEERRRDQTRLLVELEELLPKKDSWYMSLTHSNGALKIEGVARDKETVSSFLKKLENGEAKYINPYSINPNEIAQNMVINNMLLTRFTISATTYFPQPTLLNEGIEELQLLPKDEFLKLVQDASPGLVTARESATGKKAGL